MDAIFIAHFALGAGVGLPVGLVLREAIVAVVTWLRERRSTADMEQIGLRLQLWNERGAEMAKQRDQIARLIEENNALDARLAAMQSELALARLNLTLRDIPAGGPST